MNERRTSIRAYYQGTWWVLACLTSLISAIAEVAPRALVAVSFVLAASSLLPFARRLPARTAFVCAGIFLALCAGIGFFRYRAEGDVISGIGCVLIGFWPMALWYRELKQSNWLALVEVFLLALVSLVLGEEAIEYFLFLCIAVTFIFNLNASYLYFHVGAVEAAHAKVPPRYFRMFAYSTGVGFMIALAIFLLLPRSIHWVNPFGVRQKAKSLGLGNDVTLDGSNVRDNPALALRVETRDTAWLAINGPTLYFRGRTVERFDGMRWQTLDPERTPLQDPKAIRFRRGPLGTLRYLKIYREASTNESVLYPGMLVDVIAPWTFRSSLRYDGHGNLYRYRSEANSYWYEIAVSLMPNETESFGMSVKEIRKALAADPKELPNRADYLQVPKSVADKPYYRNWIKELNLDPNKVDLRQILGTVGHEFRTKFKATYEHQIPTSSAFAYFLARGREGHCEYFATATTLLFRTLGIPARLVMGFRGGDFNSLARVLEVRNSSAHAWVEFYLPHTGWVAFDPTPAAQARIFPSTAADYLQLTASAVSFWFERYIVGYNLETQTRLATDLIRFKPGTQGKWKFSGAWLRANSPWLVLATLLALTLWRRRRRWQPRARLPRYYRSFTRKLRRQGWTREHTETFKNFHNRLTAAGANAAVIGQVDEALHRDLYSTSPLTPAERRNLHRLLKGARLLFG